MFSRVAIIGLGLIGGSFGAGLRKRKLADEVVAWDRNERALQKGLDRGVIDVAAGSIAEAVAGAELVMVAVPMLAVEETLGAIAPHCGPDTIITDVGSVKGMLFEAAERAFGEIPANLVPGHPIAGSERHGVQAADPDLFVNHKVILTPKLSTNGDATRAVRELWQALDAQVVEMDAPHHDIILAQTSHLPHLLAYALVDTLSQQGDSLEIFQYAAGGFRDFSRIAASDPVMWRDIFAANPGPVLEILDRFTDDLARLRALIAEGDSNELARVFARAKTARDHFAMLIAQRDADTRKHKS